MTEILQVGDIVYVNLPSEEDERLRDREGLTDDIDDFIGRCAIIQSIESIEYTAVRLSPCHQDYIFKLEDNESILRLPEVSTVVSHLTLVRPSILHTCQVTDPRLNACGLQQLPTAGSRLDEGFSFQVDGLTRTVFSGAFVDEVYLHVQGIGVRFYNDDVEGLRASSYVTITVPTEHIDGSQLTTALFTTF